MQRVGAVVLGLLLILAFGYTAGRYGMPLPGSVSIGWDFWAVIIALATLSLAALATLIAIASVWVVIWGKPWIEDLVRREARAAAEASREETLGLVNGYVGFIYGRLRDVKPEFVDRAIAYTEAAIRHLPDDSPWKRQARNNLAFYYAERGNAANGPRAVALAKQLLEVDYVATEDRDYLTTYARVVAAYYRDTDDARSRLEQARRLMEEIEASAAATPAEKASATQHLDRLRVALESLISRGGR